MGMLSGRYQFFLLEGIFLTLLGLFCLAAPGLATYSFEFLIGAALLLSGLMQGFRVAFTKEAPGQNFTLLSSLLLVLVGLSLWLFPWLGLLTTTLLLSAFFFVDGVLKLLSAFQYRFFSKWIWYIISAVLEIMIAMMIWQQWPLSAAWFIGMLIGVNFFFLGIVHIIFALEVRRGGPITK